jgi:hypothetical protein
VYRTRKGAEDLGALSGLVFEVGLFAAADLQAEFVGKFVRFVERATTFFGEQNARFVFCFFRTVFDRFDDRFNRFLFAARGNQGADPFRLSANRRRNDFADHFFLLRFGRFFGVDSVFVGEFFGFAFDRFIAFFANRVGGFDEFRLGQRRGAAFVAATAVAAIAAATARGDPQRSRERRKMPR